MGAETLFPDAITLVMVVPISFGLVPIVEVGPNKFQAE